MFSLPPFLGCGLLTAIDGVVEPNWLTWYIYLRGNATSLHCPSDSGVRRYTAHLTNRNLPNKTSMHYLATIYGYYWSLKSR